MFVNENGAVLRTDGAPSFQSIKSQIEQKSSILCQFNVSVELGQSHHANKNPNAEFAIKEGHAAINRHGSKTLLSDQDLTIIARNMNQKIRSLGYSSYELFSRRSKVDNSIITRSDSDIADIKHANKLHLHNPPVTNSSQFRKGDLVMIKSDRSKIKPRDTYIVDSVIERNGCQWAELFKMGNKLVNKPQLVKIEDIFLITPDSEGSRPKRKAAAKASLTIKDLVPYIRAIVQSMVPKHSWDYERMVQMFRNGDLEFESDINASIELNSENEDATSEDNETEGSSENFFSTSDNSNSSIQSSPTHTICENDEESLSNLLDNPSIQIYPQSSNQVELNSVQNLANVFDDLYQTPRQSQRLAAKPSKDYKAMLNPRY